ncbi:MAG: hypothetical protein ACNA8W_11365 [Bradymonadaceae bacterium]
MLTKKAFLIVAIFGAFILIACGQDYDQDDHDNNGGITPEEEACLHANDTPTQVAAAATPEEAQANINDDHTHYRISLVESTETPGEFSGAVTFEPDRDGDFAIFTSHVVPVQVIDDEGESESVTTRAVDECVEMARMHIADFHDDEIYVIVFGPTSESEISVIVEYAGGSGDQDHENHGH